MVATEAAPLGEHEQLGVEEPAVVLDVFQERGNASRRKRCRRRMLRSSPACSLWTGTMMSTSCMRPRIGAAALSRPGQG
jgi:hypothetical protein